MKCCGQIINVEISSYNGSKKVSRRNMKKKKDTDQYKIVREYKNVFSCNELIERIIRYHMEEENSISNAI